MELQSNGHVYFWTVTIDDGQVLSSAFGHCYIGDVSAPMSEQQCK
jgi:hypothetical protein